jgi:hypothetical protein
MLKQFFLGYLHRFYICNNVYNDLLVSILFIICVNVKCIKLSYILIFCYIILNALMIM